MTTSPDSETQRILGEYERRAREVPPDFYALYRPANLFNYQGQQRALLKALHAAAMIPLAERRILETGCGQGQWLAIYEAFGAQRANLAAVDLDPARAAFAAARFPGADIRQGNATELPWSDKSFDIVSQSTMFTSVLDPATRLAIAGEMLRVLKTGGAILWYDFLFDNPRNPNVRGIGRSEIRRLFPGCETRLWRVTLAPPLARRLVPVSWSLARLLEKFRILNTHYFGIVRKPA